MTRSELPLHLPPHIYFIILMGQTKHCWLKNSHCIVSQKKSRNIYKNWNAARVLYQEEGTIYNENVLVAPKYFQTWLDKQENRAKVTKEEV